MSEQQVEWQQVQVSEHLSTYHSLELRIQIVNQLSDGYKELVVKSSSPLLIMVYFFRECQILRTLYSSSMSLMPDLRSTILRSMYLHLSWRAAKASSGTRATNRWTMYSVLTPYRAQEGLDSQLCRSLYRHWPVLTALRASLLIQEGARGDTA